MRKKVKLNNIHLDSKNPRFITRINKGENIANFMVKHSKTSHIKDMLEDIIQNGLSPLDVIGVFKENDKYIALDGNRRALALKMIYDNNSIIISNEIQEILNLNREKIKKREKKLLDELEVFIFDNREESKKWLNRKHTNDYGGASAQDWPTLEKKIFQEDKMALLISREADKAKIEYDDYAINIKYTIWERFFTSQFSRKWLGIQYMKENKEFIVQNEEQLHERMKVLVIATQNKELNFNSVNKKRDKSKVIKMLNEKYLANSIFQKEFKIENKKRVLKKPSFFNEAIKYITNDKLNKLINQINKLKNIETYKELLACSIRPMVEISVNTFLDNEMKKSKKWFNDNDLKSRIIETISNLKNIDRKNKTTIKYIEGNINSSILAWNGDLHDSLFSSSKYEIDDSLKRISVLLEEIWKNIN